MSAEEAGLNLDRLCAQYGWEICDEVSKALTPKDKPNGKPDKAKTENLVTKSLGVLQEDGVYAFFLYQASRGAREKDGAAALRAQAHALFRAVAIKPFGDVMDSLEAVRGNKEKNIKGLADDLDSLLLAKRLLEQALIYARYHAKALEE